MKRMETSLIIISLYKNGYYGLLENSENIAQFFS